MTGRSAPAVDDDGDSPVVAGSTRDLRAMTMNILSPVAAALGTMSAALLVIGIVVVAVVLVLGLAYFLVIQSFTTVGG